MPAFAFKLPTRRMYPMPSACVMAARHRVSVVQHVRQVRIAFARAPMAVPSQDLERLVIARDEHVDTAAGGRGTRIALR